MKYRGIIDATLGRLLLPLRSASDAVSGALWLDSVSVYVRGNDLAKTLLRLLTSADVNAPNGIAGLDAMGKIGVDQLPPEVVTSTGGSSSASGSTGLVGEIRMWGGDPFQLDNGWMAADGPELSQAAFPALFKRYGHRWGVPSDYATKFRGPNLVDRVPLGAPGANNASSGRIHKINIVSPGAGFNASATTLVTLASTGGQLTSAATANITTDADGAVVRIDLVSPGVVSSISATPTVTGAGKSNCEIYIPLAFGPGNGQFEYEITVAPTASSAHGWAVRLSNRGSSYTTAPAVTFNAGCTATGIAILEGDQVREVVITNPGSGTPPTTVSFAGGGGSGAAGSIVSFTAATAVGDLGGEQAHAQLIPELALHNHGGQRIGSNDSPGSKYGGTMWGDAGTNIDQGSNAPMSVRSPYAGVLFIFYAGA